LIQKKRTRTALYNAICALQEFMVRIRRDEKIVLAAWRTFLRRIQREALSQLASCRARAIHIPTAPFIRSSAPAAGTAAEAGADVVDGGGTCSGEY
jgi:hypothetical protein